MIIPYVISCVFLLGTLVYSFLVFQKSITVALLPFGAVATLVPILAAALRFKVLTARYVANIYDPYYLGSKREFEPGYYLAYCTFGWMFIVIGVALRLLQLEFSIVSQPARVPSNQTSEIRLA